MTDYQKIFDHWNSRKKGGKWWSHRKISHDINAAIKENLKNFSADDICAAITNYAMVLQGKDYYWTYQWGLADFLIRKLDDDKRFFKWYQFLPNNFQESQYLKPEVRRQRASARRRQYEVQEQKQEKPIDRRSMQEIYAAKTDEELEQEWATGKFFYQHYIRKYRPDFVKRKTKKGE